VGGGLVFKERDPESLAAAVESLADHTRREQIGRRGKDAFARSYNWSLDERRLLECVERAAAAHGERR
jgi:glycosyltransferase involved in cell wall biosynthesis